MEDYSIRIYITDTLRSIGENTANAFGGSFPKHRWQDMAEGKVEIDNRSADEIVDDVIKHAGLEVIE